jgi:hypothetical protein
MRRIALLIGMIVATLAFAPGAHAQVLDRALAADGDRVALIGGRGFAIFRSTNGAILGSLGRGRLVIIDRRRPSGVEVTGCETRKRVKQTLICTGRAISFYIEKGSWVVRIRGRGIEASAVLSGTLTLAGRAGKISLNDGDERNWPRRIRTLRLG